MNILKNIVKYFISPNYRANYLLSKIIEKPNSFFVRKELFYKFHIQVGVKSQIGENLICPHPFDIVIGNGAKIGENCTIYHNVTIGKKRGNIDDRDDYPTIGNNVTIFPGAKIFGNIKIGNNAIIAANSVVNTDVEKDCIYGGVPAKKISEIDYK